jgi:hypothetical protein
VRYEDGDRIRQRADSPAHKDYWPRPPIKVNHVSIS